MQLALAFPYRKGEINMPKKHPRAFKLVTPVKGNSDPMQSNIIARAQSILTKDGKLGPVLPYEEALAVIRKHENDNAEPRS